MKSVKTFGKKVPILGILLIAILAFGGVYAALVNYLSNTIVQKADIDSPIALAGEVMYWPAAGGVLGVEGSTEVEFTTAFKHGYSYSAHLDTADSPTGGDEARIVIPVPIGTTLGQISSISWFVYAVAGYPPHVDIILEDDIDGIPETIDSLTAELAENDNPENKEWSELQLDYVYSAWHKTFEYEDLVGDPVVDDGTILWVTRHGAGCDDAPYGKLSELKAGAVTYPVGYTGPTITISSDVVVLKLEIEVDNWLGEAEAYVDDVKVDLDGAIDEYSFEPDTEDFTDSADLPIFAGSEFYFSFDAINRANLPMDGKLQIVITPGTTEFDPDPPAGKEFVLEDNGYSFELEAGDPDFLVLTADEDVTFEPVVPVELPLHLVLVPNVEEDVYTFTAQIVIP